MNEKNKIKQCYIIGREEVWLPLASQGTGLEGFDLSPLYEKYVRGD